MEKKKCKTTKQDRIGETNINKQGEEMVIVEYNNCDDISVQFTKTKEIIKNTRYDKFKNSSIKSHFSPSVHGVGIKGVLPTTDKNGKLLNSYTCWYAMLNRCYSAKYQERQPTYMDCSVSDEFKIYENFKNFYDENYYEIKELGGTQLDKDILYKNNKIYSKENCIFVPHAINELFTKRQNERGDLPIGVTLSGKKYLAQCNVGNGEQNQLGTYSTPELAFNVYKEFKEKLIKNIAMTYKSQIPIELYEAMMNYIVEITD